MMEIEMLLTPYAVAERLGLKRQTLARWRVEWRGPAWCRIGGAVRYPAQELAQWILAQSRTPNQSKATNDDA